MSGFVVTSLRHAAYDARTIYEEPLCRKMAAAVGNWVDANVQTIGCWIGDTVEMSMNGISQPSGPKVARWRRCRDGFPRAPCSMLPFADRMISTRKISVSTDHSCHLLQRASGLVESSAKRMCLSNTLSEVIFALLVSYRRHRLCTPCAAMKRLRGVLLCEAGRRGGLC